MEIVIAKSAGFCFGVQNAVKIAKSFAGKNGVILGEIIHNRRVVEELIALGVPYINDMTEYRGGTVIIRSHGVPKRVVEYLKERAIPYVDATCPFVKKIHNLVETEYSNGKSIIIVGERDHPEVIGINGWCDDSAIIVKDTAFPKLDTDKEYAVVSQTTFPPERYSEIVRFIKNQVKTVEFFNTICYTTKERQTEAENMAKSCDCMLIIGGKHSSNTIKLYELCKRYCDKTFLIESIADIRSVVAYKINRLGITAGASTPKELIEEVVNVMSESQDKSTEMFNEEVDTVSNNEVKEQKSMTFGELLDTDEAKMVSYSVGKKLNVTVIKANEDGIFVSFGGKKEGFIDKSEATVDPADYNPEDYKEGDKFGAIVVNNNQKDCVAFSKKAIDIKLKEQKECEEILKGSEFSVEIEKAVKGGLLSKLGPYTIFVPASQIRIGYVQDLEKYVGKTMRLRMIPAKKDETAEAEQDAQSSGEIKGRRIVASQKVILEEEKQAKEDKFWEMMQVGEIVKGKVKRFTDFGAFVSVNGNDCLAHISDLSWWKIESPAEVLEINKTYDFLILKADRESNKVSLGYKQLQKKPYELAAEELPVGTVIKGVVERVFPYGAFVSIQKGVDGLIPVSEISYEWIKNASEKFKPGDEVEAKIISFDGNKITLSTKALMPEPEDVEDVEISDEDVQEHNEKKARANAKKFENKGQGVRKPRAKKSDEPEELKSWSTDSNTATFGDLLKGLTFDFDKEEKEKEEE